MAEEEEGWRSERAVLGTKEVRKGRKLASRGRNGCEGMWEIYPSCSREGNAIGTPYLDPPFDPVGQCPDNRAPTFRRNDAPSMTHSDSQYD